MKLLKNTPFFLLLLVVFFCLHGWLENFGFISFIEVLAPGILILACLILFTGLLVLFTKNILFAALIICFIGTWYLFFGALHDWVKNKAFLSFIMSYQVMVSLLLLFSLAWVFFLKYKKELHHKLALYLNLLLIIYCCVDVFLLLKIYFTKQTEQIAHSVKFDRSKVYQKPDVYLLLFDGYPGFTSLKDSFNFPNASLNNYFKTNQFKVLPVFSNYYLTYFSISSMLNLQYVQNDYVPMKLTQIDFQKRGVEINRAAVIPVFKSMGYDIENYSIFEFDDKPPVSVENSFLLAHGILLTDKILHNRLKRDLGDRLGKYIPFWKNSDFYQHDIDNKYTESLLMKSASALNNNPKLVYAHFMMPHGPYYYDSLGHKNKFDKIANYTMWGDKDLFISYLKYINNRIMKMTDTIISHDANAVIIIMGDHGFRSYQYNRFNLAPRFDNLCAVRFKDNRHGLMENKWSNVNLFRYLFNCEFGQNLPYLADSLIIQRY